MKKAPVLIVLMVVVAGCSRKRAEELGVPTPSTTAPSSITANGSPTETDTAGVARAAARRAALAERVHFEFDRADITEQARVILERKLPILHDEPSLRLRIDGHADDRGSVEYNLALSLRRANAVRSYLIDAGVAAHRLEVAAFGEEYPLSSAHNENAWAVNRRAEFQILGET